MASKKFWSEFIGKLTSLVSSDKLMISDSEASDEVKYTNFSNLETSINHNNIANVALASTGIPNGHIDDQAQTIFGQKTFNDKLTVGDLVVNGTTTTVNSQTVEVKDNILLINHGEVGAGVTAGSAGIEVDRGTLTNYEFIFDESADAFKIGEIGSLQEVATREDAPTGGSVAIWDNVNKMFKTVAANTLISGLNADKVDGYDINQDLRTTAIPTFPTAKLTNLTDGFIPYHSSDSVGLADSQIKTNGKNLSLNTNSFSYKLNLYSSIDEDNRINFKGNGDSLVGSFIGRASNSKALQIKNTEESDIEFYTNNLNRVLINKDGNVGIGKTPTEKLDVAGNIKVSGNMLRMTGVTTTIRDGLTAQAGDIIYNTTLNKHQAYDGTTWNNMY